MRITDWLPRARTDELVIQPLPDETLVYDLTRHKAHCLNRTAASVWEQCDGQTTVADMASRLARELKAPVSEEIVRLALEQLDTVHLLHERGARRSDSPRISRRKMVRQLGLGAAIAMPAIISIIAPEAAQAATGNIPNGQSCTSSSECESGCCNQNGNVCVDRAQGAVCV